ncbi:hypothetical protein [Burkholderia multivorans]|uniref:hypothetical protein n=2 Tax=Burkholderia multivorans TaxID=87883 RepID=UPI003BF977DC
MLAGRSGYRPAPVWRIACAQTTMNRAIHRPARQNGSALRLERMRDKRVDRTVVPKSRFDRTAIGQRRLPVPVPTVEQAMQWHKHRTSDPGLAWLRGLLKDAVAKMDEGRQAAR